MLITVTTMYKEVIKWKHQYIVTFAQAKLAVFVLFLLFFSLPSFSLLLYILSMGVSWGNRSRRKTHYFSPQQHSPAPRGDSQIIPIPYIYCVFWTMLLFIS